MMTFSRIGFATLAAVACVCATATSAQTTTESPDANFVSAPSSETDTTPTTPVAAESIDHEIIIIDGAYFPPLIYAQVGDRLIFVNSSSGVHVVEGPEETWTSGQIPIDGTFTLLLSNETPLVFSASADTEGVSAEEGDVILEQVGEITYDAPPING